MIVHKAIGSDLGLVFFTVFFKILTKILLVFAVKKYLLTVIPSLHSVVSDLWNYVANLSRHEKNYMTEDSACQRIN
jgi:hypothetical protein